MKKKTNTTNNIIITTLIISCFLTSSVLYGMGKSPSKKPKDPAALLQAIEDARLTREHAVIAMLQSTDYDINARGPHNETALHLCHPTEKAFHRGDRASKSSYAIALLKAGAKVVDEHGSGIKDDAGQTAFYLATTKYFPCKANIDLFELYLQKGAHPYETNNPVAHWSTISDIPPLSAFDNMIMNNDGESITKCIHYFGPPKSSFDNSPLLRAVSQLRWPEDAHNVVDVCSVETGKLLLRTLRFSMQHLKEIIVELQKNQAQLLTDIKNLPIGPKKYFLGHAFIRNRTILKFLEEIINSKQIALAHITNKHDRTLSEELSCNLFKRPEISYYRGLRARSIGLPFYIRYMQERRYDSTIISRPSTHTKKPSTSEEDKEDK